MSTKSGKLTFSGKEEDFSWFQEQFEARMYLQKLHACLMDAVTVKQEVAEEQPEATAVRIAEEAALAELQYKLWCELVQCLDRSSVMYLRAHKGNGTAAWKALKQKHKSSERPRIQKTLDKLSNLKMVHGEMMADYLTRAEHLQMDLQEVNEAVSDAMFRAMIIKGLPKEFESIVTILGRRSHWVL